MLCITVVLAVVTKVLFPRNETYYFGADCYGVLTECTCVLIIACVTYRSQFRNWFEH